MAETKSDTYVEKLTPEQREEIRQAFSFYDRDGDDKIKTTELGIVIRSLGHGKKNQSTTNIQQTIKRFNNQILFILFCLFIFIF